MNTHQDVSYDILILIADSYSLTPDEKIRITHAISEGQISSKNVDALSAILIKEQRAIGNEQAKYIKNVIGKAIDFEKEKYSHTSMKYLKEKFSEIHKKYSKVASELDRYMDYKDSELLLQEI